MVQMIKEAGEHYGCRLDICSYDPKRPVSASDAAGNNFGFGLTPEEAVADLNRRIGVKKTPVKV